MKRKIILTESELVNFVKLIIEQFEEEDYLEVFFKYFRPWLKEKHGDEISEMPMSYLTKKYMKEFAAAYDLENYVNSYSALSRNMSNIGRGFVEKKIHQLRTLRKTEKFTERYKKALDTLLEILDVPNGIVIRFKEDKPYEVNGSFHMNWPIVVSNPNSKTVYIQNLQNEIYEKISSLFGVDLGVAEHGELYLTFDRVIHVNGFEDWVKNVFNKDIKKKIRAIDTRKIISRIGIELETYLESAATVRIAYKRGSGWGFRTELIRNIKTMLEENGYNTQILKVEFY